ncbi:putative two-component response regulator [Tetragenococcus halophilus subsp. halophilus]|uniref:Putative two-component response regulator n=1 Tax=Tetragenococcus halophilus subsp. halophilus TaxID=1513897 RepID=A0A2H6CVZ2_TETHA|nr:DNA-binding domain-containing protein [Tetragenococcus halophilus]RQD30860.1 hypothetical protein C7K42_07840 [Tetragenococcus halophilus subsp. halophilus DSM 20339]GBD60033.1 putative two-component response regulator [Tetragenococcus halophilus subsp. halophilus]GBD69158.1 putative two-component response regulator [Tetragenococcus halophilus subsp. halophilus]GBD81235.1 putative two-component response regulator [Tetragenococcus halophilus subsp. halophilus]GBD82869.1 putative two-componen
MNFYIIDDDISILVMLQKILEKNTDYYVIGKATEAEKALTDILLLDVDVVLIDLLIPNMSGIELMNRLKISKNYLHFIMISKVTDNSLKQEAYEAGVEFFINKPINVIELQTVVEKIVQNIDLSQKLINIQSLIGENSENSSSFNTNDSRKQKVLSILRLLGINSDAGTTDILVIYEIISSKNLYFNQIDICEQLNIDAREKKIIFQRIRRAIKHGLTNLANLYLDDAQDEIITEYANSLYGYKNIRNEMQFINGYRDAGGRVSLRHFLDGLVQETDNN